MAWTYKHPKSGIYQVGFWYEDFQYRKSLRTHDKRKAGEHAKTVQRAVAACRLPFVPEKAITVVQLHSTRAVTACLPRYAGRRCY